MHSQLMSDGEDCHRASNMRFLKGVAVGFGAALLLATIVNMAASPAIEPEPSSLIAWPSVLRTGPLRGTVVYGGRYMKDGNYMKDSHFAPKQGMPEGSSQQTQYYQPQFQQPTRTQPAAPVAPGQYSQEQLEFLRRTGKAAPAAAPQQYQQPVSARPAQTNWGWDSPADKGELGGFSDGYGGSYHSQKFS
jgi:hypothetical protein